jgi:hypothetical protein
VALPLGRSLRVAAAPEDPRLLRRVREWVEQAKGGGVLGRAKASDAEVLEAVQAYRRFRGLEIDPTPTLEYMPWILRETLVTGRLDPSITGYAARNLRAMLAWFHWLGTRRDSLGLPEAEASWILDIFSWRAPDLFQFYRSSRGDPAWSGTMTEYDRWVQGRRDQGEDAETPEMSQRRRIHPQDASGTSKPDGESRG